MTYANMNNYFYHYLTSDKTASAIMLTGKWGTGKSYYIRNSLIPYIAEKTGNSKNCIVVSLYGLKDVKDICKMIYFELRLSFLPSSEIIESGKAIGRTIVKAISSFHGVDISSKEGSFESLYKSINLTGKLIILEDLERSSISVIEVLGYINNLVEQDGAKILIVANEDEMLKYSMSEPDSQGKTYRIPNEMTAEYLKTKEKTVSDTVVFESDYNHAIISIMNLFDNRLLRLFVTNKTVEDVSAIMLLSGQYNLRSFLFACQKTADIFESIYDTEYEREHVFLECVFYGIVAFSFRFKTGETVKWDSKIEELSTELGMRTHPLFRFCYYYILYHTFDYSAIEQAYEALKKYKLYNLYGSQGDKDLEIVFNCTLYPETSVLTALSRIEDRLDNAEDIPFYDYGKLIPCFIRCHTLLGFDYSTCEEKMTKNLKGKGSEIDTHILFLSCSSDDENEQRLIDTFVLSISSNLDKKEVGAYGFSYKPEDAESFYNTVNNEKEKIRESRVFVSSLDIDKIAMFLKHCNSEQLYFFRLTIGAVYKNASKDSFIGDDCTFLSSMIQLLEAMDENIDRIIMWQRKILKERIQAIVNSLL